ncbi:glycoside hydrolase family 140 protein [Deinococcus aestuarii]|uniref:glycoside hydrolase family 140 protein n=1 Tax=Deinococcus aestuarii TaxID=2774531 RepID=UPI001C0BDF9C|nr:glycoside hydrolase family 140 protein [Deinococcus aestuarii]
MTTGKAARPPNRRWAALALGLLITTGAAQGPGARPAASASPAPATPARLEVSPDGRRLQHADGRPFLYWADTGWELFHRLNRDDARTYLRTRRSQGFTVIQAVALAEMDGLTVPNAQGDLPLAGKDPSRPLTTPGNNPASPGEYDYWDHVDYVVDEAASLGLHVTLLPSWGRWVNDEPIFTPESARSYGAFLGQRYGNKPVIWMLGGDRNPETEAQRAVWRAMADGIEQGSGGRDRALMTYHPRGGKTSAEFFHDEPWLDFNVWQTGHCRDVQEAAQVLSTFGRTPIKPVINAEPVYEDHAVCHDRQNGFTDEVDVRNVAYWSMFAGAAGHAYGHRLIWGFDVYDGDRAWLRALGAPGVRQLEHLKALLASRPAQGRRPDASLVEGGFSGVRPVVALRGPDYAWVYLPDGGAATVSLEGLGRPVLQASWFDPRTGQTTRIGPVTAPGRATFTAPSRGRGEDWLLRLEPL